MCTKGLMTKYKLVHFRGGTLHMKNLIVAWKTLNKCIRSIMKIKLVEKGNSNIHTIVTKYAKLLRKICTHVCP